MLCAIAEGYRWSTQRFGGTLKNSVVKFFHIHVNIYYYLLTYLLMIVIIVNIITIIIIDRSSLK